MASKVSMRSGTCPTCMVKITHRAARCMVTR
ncbi:Uncharacterised protein [Mycobacteroides abscessus subsp. abscessus]|nr:Uncharacterised protein [Mycobacteroides abscessus subsp. abscessus]